MVIFTKQERLVLIVLVCILVSGSMMRYVYKQFPEVKSIVNLLESDIIYPKIDINMATATQLESLPYIGKYTASNIVQRRQQIGRFNSLEELKSVKGIYLKNFNKFRPYLLIENEK